MAAHENNTNSTAASTMTTDGKASESNVGNRDEKATTPSKLFVQYSKKKTLRNGASRTEGECSTEDTEALLQSALSALATQPDLVEAWDVGSKGEISDWIWHSIAAAQPAETNQEGLPVSAIYPLETPQYEWWMGMQLLAILVQEISPFEIHTAATQSSVFTEGSQSHWTLCLLLCAYSLRQCPTPLETRWKRWQSLVCETIRLFQTFGMETGYHAVPMWIHHIVPACQHVIRQLPPSDALQTGLLSGLVGTTSILVMKECDRLEQVDQAALLSRGYKLLKTLRAVVHDGGQSDEWIWSNPWRSIDAFLVEEQDVDIAFENHKSDIAWWSKVAHKHEKVAGMDTSWDDSGISLFALMAFDDRPLTLTPTFIWNTWFPHVAILFKVSTEYHFLESLPLLLLDKLFKVVPERSLPAVSSASKQVDCPYETFQLLSNRIMVKPAVDHKPIKKTTGGKKLKNELKEMELESKARSERVVGLMKSLLNRYPTVNQIKIVRKLVHDCPHPGLQVKFMDLLRPVVFEEECAEAFWSYIGSFIKDLLAHVDESKGELRNTSDLINKVEIYVGAITMIQLWCMIKGKLPKKIKGHPLGKFYKTLKKGIAAWMNNEGTMPPDDYYRLYLLEGALQQVMHILDSARQKRKQEDGSLSSSHHTTTDRTEESSADEGPKSTKGDNGDVVVGDIDIFS